LNLKEGDSYQSYVTIDQEIKQELAQKPMEKPMDMVQNVGTGYTMDVISVDSLGRSTVKLTYNSVYFKTSGILGEVEYDSENPPEGPSLVALALGGMVGRSFEMKFTPRGEVIDVLGVEEMIAGIIENMGLISGFQGKSVEAMLHEQFGGDALKEMMENWLIAFPEDSVRVGDAWSRTVTRTTGFTTISDQRWTLRSRENGICVVDVRASLATDTTEVNDSGLDFDVTGELEGTFEVDEATGFSIRGGVELEMAGDVDAGITSWPISIKTTTRFEPIESNE
jgi:hypothetical protein